MRRLNDQMRVASRDPSVITLGANVAILATSVLAGVVSARILGPSGRGQLTVVALWSGIIHMVGSLGLQSSCSYYLARWPHRQTALVAWFRRVAARQAIGMTVVSFIILWWLHIRLGLGTLLTIEYMTWAAAGTIALYGTVYAQGSFNFSRFNRIRLISGASPAALMLIGALVLRLTPAEAGAAYLVPAWCGAALAAAWLYRGGRADVPTEPLSRQELRSIWSYGWRSVASLSGLALNNSADQFTLAFMVPAGSLGLYSVGAAAATPIPTLTASFGMVGLPTVAALTGEAKAAAAWRTLRRAAFLLALAGPPSAVLLPWAIPWFYGARYASAVVPAEFLLVGACFAALTTVTDASLRAYGLPGAVSLTQGAGAAVTIAGTLLIEGHPLADVALASSLGFILSFALALFRLRVAIRHPRRAAIARMERLDKKSDRRTRRGQYSPVHARSGL
jgi:antigen flippase